MILAKEAKLIRRWVGQLRPGRGRKYTPALRQRILAYVEEAKALGMREIDCSAALGVPQDRFAAWRQAEPTQARQEAEVPFDVPLEHIVEPVSKALVPIEVTPSTIQLGGGLTIVTPRGFRVEGLSIEQAYALLREFE
jgi:hypothetical protein